MSLAINWIEYESRYFVRFDSEDHRATDHTQILTHWIKWKMELNCIKSMNEWTECGTFATHLNKNP